MRMLKLPDGRVKILVQGVSKARFWIYPDEPFYTATIEKITDQKVEEMTIETEAIMRTVKEQLDKAVPWARPFSLTLWWLWRILRIRETCRSGCLQSRLKQNRRRRFWRS